MGNFDMESSGTLPVNRSVPGKNYSFSSYKKEEVIPIRFRKAILLSGSFSFHPDGIAPTGIHPLAASVHFRHLIGSEVTGTTQIEVETVSQQDCRVWFDQQNKIHLFSAGSLTIDINFSPALNWNWDEMIRDVALSINFRSKSGAPMRVRGILIADAQN